MLAPKRQDVILEQVVREGGAGLADLVNRLGVSDAAGTRVVSRGEHWTAFLPVAARWPIELRVGPHRPAPDLAALSNAERHELAGLYADVLRRLDAFFPTVAAVPYIAAWHQAPVRQERDLLRLHLQVFSIMRAPGKLKYLAGSESAMGAWVNDTTPERIAARLREVGG